MSIEYFGRVAGLGDRMLNAIGGTGRDQAMERYLAALREVYTRLGQIHEHVLDVTLEVGIARDHAQAAAALDRLQALGLESVMRAAELCNELERLGHELTGIEKLSEADAAEWEEFRSALQRREAGTSDLYDQKLLELRNLARHEPDLDALKRQVAAVSHELVMQKAEFEWLARRADKELQRT